VVKSLPTGNAQGVTDIVSRAQRIFERQPALILTKKTPSGNRWKKSTPKPEPEAAKTDDI
jgi:hypothetical protein